MEGAGLSKTMCQVCWFIKDCVSKVLVYRRLCAEGTSSMLKIVCRGCWIIKDCVLRGLDYQRLCVEGAGLSNSTYTCMQIYKPSFFAQMRMHRTSWQREPQDCTGTPSDNEPDRVLGTVSPSDQMTTAKHDSHHLRSDPGT